MQWITNTTPSQIDASLRSLSVGGRRVVKGEPNATETHTAAGIRISGLMAQRIPLW